MRTDVAHLTPHQLRDPESHGDALEQLFQKRVDEKLLDILNDDERLMERLPDAIDGSGYQLHLKELMSLFRGDKLYAAQQMFNRIMKHIRDEVEKETTYPEPEDLIPDEL